MSIEAGHWANIVARVTEHAKKLYPDNPEKQQDLIDELLAITTPRTLAKRGRAADVALERMRAEIAKPPADAGTQSWLTRAFRPFRRWPN